MRILIDIGHPAQVHYFRNFCNILLNKGHQILFTTRDKEVTIQLLDHYGFQYVNFGKHRKSRVGKVFGLIFFTLRILFVSMKFKPDIYLNASMYSGIIAWLLRKPHISLEDTFNMEQVKLYMPFTSCVLTGDYPHTDLGNKQVSYSSYQELFYLHPNFFRPDKSILNLLNVKETDKYVIIRFVSWNASHDAGQKGLGNEQKLNLLEQLSSVARVFVSSEGALSEEMEKYRIRIPPWRMHDVLAFASLFIGEGATMASECAVLGVPAIYINTQHVPYVLEQQNKYGLTFCFKDSSGIIEKAKEILSMSEKSDWEKKRKRLLDDKIDATAFLVWFVENYPQSIQTVNDDPEFQLRFK